MPPWALLAEGRCLTATVIADGATHIIDPRNEGVLQRCRALTNGIGMG